MNQIIKFIFIVFIINYIFSSDFTNPEHRGKGDCGGKKIEMPSDINPNSQNGSSKNSFNAPYFTKEQKEEIKKNFPSKITIERPKIIARFQYDNKPFSNPNALKNILFYIDKYTQTKTLNINSHKDLKLTDEQKKSIFDQLKEFDLNFEEKDGDKIENSITSGNVSYPTGGDEALSKFEIINENIKYESDAYPIIFMNGTNEFELDDMHTDLLKSYLIRGGFLFADAASGSEKFSSSFKKLILKMFPEKKLEILNINHPLYSVTFNLKTIRYSGKNKSKNNMPRIEGLNIGCRTAVLFSMDAVSCAWDGHTHGELIDNEIYYEDAIRLGVNLISYVIGYRDITHKLPKIKTFNNIQKYNGLNFAFAQIKFNGDFDPDQFGIQNLIEYLNENTQISVYPKRILIDLEKDNLFDYPFLYLTGHGKINISETELNNLKTYLENGGFLLCDACCGDKDFNNSFKTLINKCFQNNNLKELNADHKIYKLFNELNNKKTPKLEGFYLKDRLAVLYSPLDLMCSIEMNPCLICKGLTYPSNHFGENIIANILVYLLTE